MDTITGIHFLCRAEVAPMDNDQSSNPVSPTRCLFICLLVWLVGCWFIGWLVGWQVGWMVGCLVIWFWFRATPSGIQDLRLRSGALGSRLVVFPGL